MRALLAAGLLLSAQCSAPQETREEDSAASRVAPRSVADELGVIRVDPDRIRAMGDEEAAAYVERLSAELEHRREQMLAAPRDPLAPPRPLIVIPGDTNQPSPIARAPLRDPILDTELPTVLPKAQVGSAQPSDPARTIRLEIVCTNFGTQVPRREPGAEQIPGSKASVLEGHEIHFLLDGERIDEPDALRQRLLALAGDPRARVPDPALPGETMLKAVLIAPGEGATYGDVAVTVDAVTSAGFSEIIFGRRRGSR